MDHNYVAIGIILAIVLLIFLYYYMNKPTYTNIVGYSDAPQAQPVEHLSASGMDDYTLAENFAVEPYHRGRSRYYPRYYPRRYPNNTIYQSGSIYPYWRNIYGCEHCY